MGKIVVVTDSSANVPPDVADELGILTVPLVVTFDGQGYHDGVDLSPSQVYRWLREGKYATTASPTLGDFEHAYENAVAGGASGIVSVHMSPKLSATHSTAGHAARLAVDVPVRVVDSQSAAMGSGFAAIEAAREAAAGGDLESVAARAADVGSRSTLLLLVPSLKYMRRGGRLGEAATRLATNLKIRPILTLSVAKIDLVGVTRSVAKGLSRMVNEMEKQLAGRRPHLAVFHADAPEGAEDLRRRVDSRFDCAELYVTQFTPVMGAHTGPGVLGLAFYGE
jgi:DegV family protein with EDD domain